MAAADCIADALGQRYVDSVPPSLEKTWAESTFKTPIICLLSPGKSFPQLLFPLRNLCSR